MAEPSSRSAGVMTTRSCAGLWADPCIGGLLLAPTPFPPGAILLRAAGAGRAGGQAPPGAAHPENRTVAKRGQRTFSLAAEKGTAYFFLESRPEIIHAVPFSAACVLR